MGGVLLTYVQRAKEGVLLVWPGQEVLGDLLGASWGVGWGLELSHSGAQAWVRPPLALEGRKDFLSPRRCPAGHDDLIPAVWETEAKNLLGFPNRVSPCSPGLSWKLEDLLNLGVQRPVWATQLDPAQKTKPEAGLSLLHKSA